MLDILDKNVIFLKTFNPKLPFIELWFTDKNSKLQEMNDKINITSFIDECVKYTNDLLFN